ncbi:MAG TPA: hypothetical protein VMV27_13600 [Candidatus Binataceae bacterium]|nr:hypothetical protein [Candidatus Binataceae bacterium]
MKTSRSNPELVHPTRLKLAVIGLVFGSTICAFLVYRLSVELAFGAGSEVGGVATASAMFARLGTFAIIFAGGIIPFLLGERFGPNRELKIVNYSFATLHWGLFLLLCVASWQAFRSIRSGDATSLVMAACAVVVLPLEIGRFRTYLCVLLAIACLLVLIAAPRAENVIAALMCFLLLWLWGTWNVLRENRNASTPRTPGSVEGSSIS